MVRVFVFGLLLSASASACSGSDATCAVCGKTFTNDDCARFAKAQGCKTGVAASDSLCGNGTTQCTFTGCPGHAIQCSEEGGP